MFTDCPKKAWRQNRDPRIDGTPVATKVAGVDGSDLLFRKLDVFLLTHGGYSFLQGQGPAVGGTDRGANSEPGLQLINLIPPDLRIVNGTLAKARNPNRLRSKL